MQWEFRDDCVRFKSEAPPMQQDVSIGSKIQSMPVSGFREGSQDPCDSTKATDFRPLLDHQPQAASTWNVDLAKTKTTTLAASCRLVLRSLPLPPDNQRADIPPPERKADCHKVSNGQPPKAGADRQNSRSCQYGLFRWARTPICLPSCHPVLTLFSSRTVLFSCSVSPDAVGDRNHFPGQEKYLT